MARIIDVVDHVNVMDDELVYREPQQGGGDFRMGSQVIVQESQAAVFVRQGQVLDALGPGSHTLSTANLPLLSGLIGLVTGGRNPFTADLYFVNLKDLPQVPWGTNPPIVLETPGKGVGVVLLITHGVIDIGIDDSVRFVKQYGVGKPILRLGDIRDRIQSMLLGEVAGLLSSSGASSIMDANRLLADLEGAALARLNEQFAAIGMRIKAFEAKPFTAKDVSTEELRNYVDFETYERIRRLEVAQSAASNPGVGGTAAGAGVGLGVGQQIGVYRDKDMVGDSPFTGGKYTGKNPVKDYQKLRGLYQKAVKEADLITVGIGFNGREIVWRGFGEERRFAVAELRLRGLHNVENVMASLIPALLAGCPPPMAWQAVCSFSGLEHRMALVRVLDGVSWYNDSKGTNVGSVIKSLAGLAPPVTLIAGGKDKGGDYAPLRPLVADKVRHLVLIGQAAERMAEAFQDVTCVHRATDLRHAVERAREVTPAGGSVLLSPACSSFDMFTSFEDRGRQFTELVLACEEKLDAATSGSTI